MHAIETIRYLSAAETAKLIRQALKAAFPGTRISVRLSRGNATYVSWTDGPTLRDVQAITHEFESQTFNSSEDIRESTNAGQFALQPWRHGRGREVHERTDPRDSQLLDGGLGGSDGALVSHLGRPLGRADLADGSWDVRLAWARGR
jgi:hypothetical protein